jgi:hypothetical protein
MAQPGKISFMGGRHLIFSAGKQNFRWFRITTTGASDMVVSFTNDAGQPSQSGTILPNTSMDFLASKLEILDDEKRGVSGVYEGVL